MTPAAQRLWQGAVLRAVTQRPTGDKVRIADLARRLALTQADVIATIELLVADFRLDPKTLRVPVPQQPVAEPPAGAPPLAPAGDVPEAIAAPPVTVLPPARALLPTGRELARKLRVEGERRGLTITKVSWQAFGNPAQMSMMQHGRRAVMQSTFDKAQAWLATPAADAAPPFTGAQLAAEIDVFLARTGMAQSRFGHLALNSPNALPRMRVQPLVRAETIARVRAFIANPPADALQQPRCRHKPKPAPRPTAAAATPPPPPQPPARVTREPAPRRDPTQRPPSLDAAESRRAGTMRHIAAIARSKEKVATDLVDAGADPTRQSTYVANQMREIIRRRAEEARQADPIEQAKLALRRRGRIVCDASVDGGRHGRFFVSGQVDDSGKRKQLDAAELTALAWKINPRGMEHLTGGAQR
jgi:hypothetical protein